MISVMISHDDENTMQHYDMLHRLRRVLTLSSREESKQAADRAEGEKGGKKRSLSLDITSVE